MRNLWVFKFWGAILAGWMLIFTLHLDQDNIGFYFVPISIICLSISIPTLLITRIELSTGGYFIIVALVLCFVGFLISILFISVFTRFLGSSVLPMIGGFLCLAFCFAYDRILLDLRSGFMALIYFILGYSALWIGSSQHMMTRNGSGFYLLWFLSVGAGATISLHRRLKHLNPANGS